MGLKSFEVECDWPGCVKSEEFCCGISLEEYGWKQRWHDLSETDFLCPEHRLKTWKELTDERSRIASQKP